MKTKTMSWIAIGLLAGLVGCGEVDPVTGTGMMTTEPDTGTKLLAPDAGHGTQPQADAAGPADAFVGRWMFPGTAAINYDCNVGGLNTNLGGGITTVAKTGPSAVTASFAFNGAICNNITFSVSGDTATADPGQMCASVVTTTIGGSTYATTVTINLSSMQVQVVSGGLSMTLSATQATTSNPGLVCTPNMPATVLTPAS